MNRPVITRNLWAPIIKPKRGAEWICWPCVRLSRREAKAELLKDLPERMHKEHLRNVRFGKVTITETP